MVPCVMQLERAQEACTVLALFMVRAVGPGQRIRPWTQRPGCFKSGLYHFLPILTSGKVLSPVEPSSYIKWG